METNEIMFNEEVIEEPTEEIVEATSRGGLQAATTIGLAMVAGGLACKFIVEPAVARFKSWRAYRKAMHQKAEFFEDDFDEDFCEEPETNSEN